MQCSQSTTGLVLTEFLYVELWDHGDNSYSLEGSIEAAASLPHCGLLSGGEQ